MAHTPGLWSEQDSAGWTVDHDDIGSLAWSAIGAEGRAPACLAVTTEHWSNPEFAANIKLIAAAPELVEALAPFAKVAEHDIGEDEADVDLFRPMSKHNHAPLLTVGDFRRALTAIRKATSA